jgi:hypothetical protein
MQISNSAFNLSINSQISNSKKVQSPVNQQQELTRVQFDKDEKSEQKQNDRLDIDPQALELVQRQDAKQAEPQQTRNTRYDQPNEQHTMAIAAYQSVENQSQQDNIKQVFGVDLLA